MSVKRNRHKRKLWRAALAAGFVLEIFFILIAILALIDGREDIPAWQQIAFVAILVWIYIAYLKQRSLDISSHVVDEKIKTHSLLENIDEGLVLLSPQNMVLVLNSSASRLTGLSDLEALGKDLCNLAGPHLRTMLLACQSGELEAPFAKGGRPLHLSVKRIESREDDDPYKLIRIREPSAAPAAGNSLEPDSEAFQALKQALQDLAAEADAPARARLVLRAQSLLLQVRAQPLQKQIQTRALAAQLRKKPMDLALLTRETLEEIKPMAAGCGIEFKLEAPETPMSVSVDAEQMRLALALLILEAAQAAGPSIALKLASLGENAGLSIMDGRPAVASGPLTELFEQPPIGQVPRSGAAYFLARGIVEAHGGSAWADSPAGGGLKVSLMIPATPA